MDRRPTEKRERLVDAAVEQFHRRGYPRASLRDIARAAGIAGGNVFYFFKTKDDLARAVVDRWCALIAGYLEDFEREPDPCRRLANFIDQACRLRDVYVTWGCPLGNLSRDLRQEGEALRSEAARVYAMQSRWIETQFRLTGLGAKTARFHARSLMAGYHGAIMLAFVQGDGEIIEAEARRLKGWLRGLRDDAQTGAARGQTRARRLGVASPPRGDT